MTASEFKTRLANGDKLAVVMLAYFELQIGRAMPSASLETSDQAIMDECEFSASHILAALASAEARK